MKAWLALPQLSNPRHGGGQVPGGPKTGLPDRIGRPVEHKQKLLPVSVPH